MVHISNSPRNRSNLLFEKRRKDFSHPTPDLSASCFLSHSPRSGNLVRLPPLTSAVLRPSLPLAMFHDTHLGTLWVHRKPALSCSFFKADQSLFSLFSLVALARLLRTPVALAGFRGGEAGDDLCQERFQSRQRRADDGHIDLNAGPVRGLGSIPGGVILVLCENGKGVETQDRDDAGAVTLYERSATSNA